MNIEFLRPACLLLLVPVLPLLWWCHRRTLSSLRGRRRVAALGVRSLVATLLVLGLAEPRWRGESQEKDVFYLVDQSQSVGKAGLDAAGRFASVAVPGDTRTAWMGFAERARIFKTYEALREGDRDALNPRETRLDTMMSLLTASYRPGRVKTAVLFTDGVSTGADFDIEALKKQSIRVHVVPVSAEDRPEVLVSEVRAPAVVRANEPLSVEATIQSTRDTTAEIDFFRNGVRLVSRKVNLKKGATEVRFEDRADQDKLLHYEVAVRSTDDTVAENNQAGAAVISEGSSKVLLLTDRPDSARYLEWALRQEGIELTVRPPEGVPSQMSDLQNYDALIFDNIPAALLSAPQMELIRSYVSDFGGGFLMLGGDQAYGLGGYFRTPVEDVLPVSCDFQKEEETPSLALSLVIDRSGSMAGENLELAKAAASASADLLGPKDYISVIAFDTESYPVVPLQAANSSGITSEIASISPGGGTNMAPAMEEALRQLSGSTAKLKHVILLTDGMSQEGPFYELATQMQQNNITVSTVAMGSGADTQLLTQIAEWGSGRYYEATDPSTVPQIFTKETMEASKSAIQEFPFMAKPIRAVDFLEGVDWTSTPFLLGYVRAKAKPTSETWLVTERGDPLLTTWRFGLGTTAAFTSDARNRWAVEWLRWPGYGKFWGQLLRRLGRSPSLGMSELSLKDENGRVRISLDALDAAQAFPVGAEGVATVSGPDGKVQTIALEKTLPGQWKAAFQASQRGIYSGQVQLKNKEGLIDSRFFTFTRGFSREFLFEPVNESLLRRLAEETGGRYAPDPAAVFLDDERSAIREYELWPWLAFLALLTFLADVAVRRWPER